MNPFACHMKKGRFGVESKAPSFNLGILGLTFGEIDGVFSIHTYLQQGRQGGVLDQGDDLVADGRNDALDHLEQGDPEEDLAAGHAQHLSGLPLAHGHPLDAAAEDL